MLGGEKNDLKFSSKPRLKRQMCVWAECKAELYVPSWHSFGHSSSSTDFIFSAWTKKIKVTQIIQAGISLSLNDDNSYTGIKN